MENVRKLMASNMDYGKFRDKVQSVTSSGLISKFMLVKLLNELVVQCQVKRQLNIVSCEHGLPKVTVITPFYNAQQFIDVFFSKLTNQTIFNHIEVICIDDCSTDNTYRKLLEYSRNYDNVILLRNDTNMGAGHSRNRGLDIATGQYISFLDSDDWYFSDNSLEKFYQDAENNDAVLCGSAITNVMQNGNLNTFFTKEKDFSFNNSFVEFDDYQNIYYFTRYLYKRSFLNEHGIRFRSFKRFQDPYFLYEVMVAAGGFYGVPYSTYCYTTNDHWSSLTPVQHYDRIVAISKLISILPAKHEKIKKFLLKSVISLFRSDNRLLEMVLTNKGLFRKYCALLFDDSVEKTVNTMDNGVINIYYNVRKEFSTNSRVSIIIPVYNGEKYIDRCLKSILD